jgi:hypothetical protein
MQSPLVLGTQSPEELEERRAAEERGEPFLVFRDGERRQRIFALDGTSEPVTVGRRQEADISLPWDAEVSRLHAELSLRAGEWTISDGGWPAVGGWRTETSCRSGGPSSPTATRARSAPARRWCPAS